MKGISGAHFHLILIRIPKLNEVENEIVFLTWFCSTCVSKFLLIANVIYIHWFLLCLRLWTWNWTLTLWGRSAWFWFKCGQPFDISIMIWVNRLSSWSTFVIDRFWSFIFLCLVLSLGPYGLGWLNRSTRPEPPNATQLMFSLKQSEQKT